MSRYFKTLFVATALVLAFALGAVATKMRLDNLWLIESSVENFRTTPDGTKLGTLLKGTEIEQIGQDGEWVRFRVEGWVWGPSLEGFEVEEEEVEEEEFEQANAAEPISPLHDALPRIKEMVNDKYGRFYGVDIDEDLDRLQMRFRVRELERAALERRIFAVQRRTIEILADGVDFVEIRIETNRPDGSGEVGTFIAATAAADLVDDFVSWRARTRFSTDGGETWEEVE